MRFRIVRDLFFSRCVAALLAVLVCGSTLGWGHVGGDDRDCNLVILHHDHTAHRLSAAPSGESTGDHCYICHSLRLLNQAVASRHERVAVGVEAAGRLHTVVLAVQDGLRVGLSSRAPPFARL